MFLQKVCYTLGVVFLTVFAMSLALVVTNKLNMWLPLIVSAVLAVAFFAARIVLGRNAKANKKNKAEEKNER